MWPFCLANNPLWLLLPFLIGLLTGWWAWAHRPSVDLSTGLDERANDVGTTDAATAAVVPAPVPEAAPAPARAVDIAPLAAIGASLTAIGIPAAVGDADDLREVKGIGPSLNALLNKLGVTRFDQIAAWGTDEIAKVDDHLGSFKGRIVRDNWVEQAEMLARGAIAEFEAKFGSHNSEN
jgi:predicted flap endonuclease-1-like 5' DNA nuclease